MTQADAIPFDRSPTTEAVQSSQTFADVRQETFGAREHTKDYATTDDQDRDQKDGSGDSDTTSESNEHNTESTEVKKMLDGFQVTNEVDGPMAGEIARKDSQLASAMGFASENLQNAPAHKLLTAGDPAKVESVASPFSEPFDRQRAERLAETFRSDTFSDRQEASHTIKKMGPEAIPFLQNKITQEKNGSNDREVIARANDAIDYIQTTQRNIDFNRLLHDANRLVPQLEKLYTAGGASMDSQGMMAVDPNGNTVRFGPMLVVGNPPDTPIGKSQEQAFNKLIKELDQANSNPLLKESLKQLEPAFSKGETDKQETDKYFRLAWLQRGGNDARTFFAQGLAESKDPAQQARARELIVESLERGSKPDLDMRITALKAGAQNDPEFQSIWKKYGGTDLLK